MIDCCLSLSDNSKFDAAQHLTGSLQELHAHAMMLVRTCAVLLVRRLC
jgi:hypothetical protein